MRDTHDKRPEEGHDALWELIPWYVNGSLPPEEMEAVEERLATSEEFAAEVAVQRRLAEKMATVDPFEAPSSQSWEKLRAQIEADNKARTPQKDAGGWLRGFRGGLLPAGLAVAAFLALIILVAPVEDGFRTLTSGGAEAETAIRFQPVAGLDADRLAQILASYGLELIAGPSEAGVYTAVPADGAEGTDLETLSETLMTAPEIVFATPSEQP
ncbi:hypothetical protein [Pontivivens ytuae]|uniref:Zinc-finger domain-containing protein n=1 Tax=Pontivivens ytuae TaxID=2789856 RepID=A0A7S9LRR3_9RHOB|nr:hypothetical protein [Pontivivens ytuae]QPH54077.1 hypothetical protein I0K15_20280 [Pontivivens ytuae]